MAADGVVVESASRGATLAEIARECGLPLVEVRSVLLRFGWEVPSDPGRRARWMGRLTVVESKD